MATEKIPLNRAARRRAQTAQSRTAVVRLDAIDNEMIAEWLPQLAQYQTLHVRALKAAGVDPDRAYRPRVVVTLEPAPKAKPAP